MGNKYGVDPLMMLDLLGPLMVVGWMAVWMLAFGPLLIYPLARWKAHREQMPDAQLGIKVALHYFALMAFQLLLFALAILLYTLFSKSGSAEKGDAYRFAFALVIPAGGVFAAHVTMLKRTNQDQFPHVRRLFLGYNLLVTGLLGFIALIFAFQVFFKKGSAGDAGRLAIAGVLVYVGAWVACAVQFMRLVLGDHSASAGPPSHHVASSAPAVSTPQQSGPVLPPLSSGSYPPIDQK